MAMLVLVLETTTMTTMVILCFFVSYLELLGGHHGAGFLCVTV